MNFITKDEIAKEKTIPKRRERMKKKTRKKTVEQQARMCNRIMRALFLCGTVVEYKL